MGDDHEIRSLGYKTEDNTREIRRLREQIEQIWRELRNKEDAKAEKWIYGEDY